MYGLGGVRHSFAHRAVNGRTHRAQGMLQASLIILIPIRCHRCPFAQGPGLHWGTHPPACDWEHTFSIFPHPAACVASLAPTLCLEAWPTGRQLSGPHFAFWCCGSAWRNFSNFTLMVETRHTLPAPCFWGLFMGLRGLATAAAA